MKPYHATASAMALILTSACATTGTMQDDSAMTAAPTGTQMPEATGYFAAKSTLPFQAPDFTKISDGDYRRSFEQGMARHNVEIERIKTSSAAPTFDNTIVALEQSGDMLGRVATVFFALTGSNTNDTLDEIQAEMGPKLSAHSDAITLDPVLFARVKAVYDARSTLGLDTEETALLEDTYEGMVQAGALLTEAQKDQVRALNTRLSETTNDFGKMVREGTVASALVVDTREELAGLPDSAIDAAAKLAGEKGMPGKFAIALQNTTQQPFLPALENRATREKLFRLSVNRNDQPGEFDTRMLVAEIAGLRAQKAALFGKPDWASYTMYDRMAKNPKTALDFMEQMVPALAATQRREAALLNTKIAEEGGDFKVQPWDWYRYAEKVKAERYAFDESAVEPYFQLDRVLEDGIFFAANKLYGLNFEKRGDLPVYHPDVSTYTVFDRDGSELGVFYFDPFQRPSKRGGAWMSNFVDQSYLNKTKPVIYNVLNIPKAADGEVQLVSFDNVNTLFHEFGHALHGFFADQKFASISGTATARDFVEYPSQVNEMWATYPAILQNYAKHYETGETIPDRTDREDRTRGPVQPGLRFRRSGGSRAARHEMARIEPAAGRRYRYARKGRCVRTQCPEGTGAGNRTGSAALSQHLFQPYLQQSGRLFVGLLQLSVDGDAGPRQPQMVHGQWRSDPRKWRSLSCHGTEPGRNDGLFQDVPEFRRSPARRHADAGGTRADRQQCRCR